MTRKPISKALEMEASGKTGDEIHTDVWGPAPIETPQHKRYYVTFTDKATHYSVAFLMHKKSETLESFQALDARWEKNYGIKIKLLRSDNGGEYKNKEFDKYLAERGIQHRFTVHNTPEHNGIAERLNRTLLEKVRAILHAADLPGFLWGEALKHAIWLKNWTSTRALGKKTPFEAFNESKPDLRNLHEWGCKVMIHNDNNNKLGARAREGRWLGLDQESIQGHRIYYEDTKTIRVERSIKFPEHKQSGEIYKVLNEGEKQVRNKVIPENIQHTPDTKSDPGNILETESPLTTPPQTPPQSPTLLNIPLAPSKPKPPKPIAPKDISSSISIQNIIEGPRTRRLANFATEVTNNENIELALTGMENRPDAPTIEEAMKRPDWPLFKIAMDTEMEAMKRTGTFGNGPIPRPPDKNIIGSKWTLRIKRKANGKIDKYKARLVARGFTQVQGVDYFETFSPTAKLSSLRTILSIATHLNWDIKVFDYSAAFLNGEFSPEEEIYMEQAPHYTNGNPKDVIQLRRTIYGLKQSSRKWYEKLTKELRKLDIHPLHSDYAVYRLIKDKDILLMAIHVDDSTITGSSPSLINDIQEEIGRIFKITLLGPISWLLGMEVTRDRESRTLTLSQKTYIDSLLQKFNMEKCKPASTPLDPSIQLSRDQCPTTPEETAEMKKFPYRELIGGLIWLTTGSRPDLAFAVGSLS